MSKSKNEDMNKINKHTHTNTLKKGNGFSRSPFRFWTFLRPYFITSASQIIFRTALTKQINTQQLT